MIGHARMLTLLAAAVMVAVAAASPAMAADGHEHGRAPAQGAIGASVDDLIAEARRTNPDLAVAALDADAAAAKIDGAGSFADPKIQLRLEDIPPDEDTYQPTRGPKTGKLFIFQELPFWGKRDLRREIAEANSRKAVALRKAVENELVAKVKTTYARYHHVHLAGDLIHEILPRLETLSKLAAARYGQALGGQQDATAAEVERTMLATELVRLETDRRKVRIRMNALLDRDPEAPLVETPNPRPLPPPEALDPTRLAERALHSNPLFEVQDAEIEASDRTTDLAERRWFPDLGVGLGAVRKDSRFGGWEAMLEMNVPIQGGLRSSEIGSARAQASAARSRRQAKAIEIESDLRTAVFEFEAARRMERLMVDSALPQARIGFESSAQAYELGRGQFIAVLAAEQQWREIHLDHLNLLLDQQMRLAEIEKMIGGEL